MLMTRWARAAGDLSEEELAREANERARVHASTGKCTPAERSEKPLQRCPKMPQPLGPFLNLFRSIRYREV